jgi:hypothetical protein
LTPQALVPFKDRTVFLIDTRACTSGAIDRAFLIADLARSDAGLDFFDVILVATAGAGLLLIATKKPPKEF